MSYIYKLIDPITNEIRYVGKTDKELSIRKNQHIRDSKRYNNHKSNWIKLLIREGYEPIIELIEECDNDKWEEREIFWISQYDNLTNGTLGGDGCVPTEETIEKLRKCNSGENNPRYGVEVSQETKDKISKALKDRTLTEKHKENLKKSSNKKQICIDGMIYESVMSASKKLNIPYSTLDSKAKSKNNQTTYYLNKKANYEF